MLAMTVVFLTMQPLISIIIPVYNHADALLQSLETVAKQTYKPFEVVIVDDGSVDRIKNYELRIQEILKDISFQIRRQENAGAPAARNKGFELSKGQYVIFWDADVIAQPEMIEKMYKALQEHPEASYAYSSFYFGKKKMQGREFDAEALRKINYIHTNSLLRREDFPRFSAQGGPASGWDVSLKKFQDWDLWLTLLDRGKSGVWIPEYLFHVLPHEGGMSAWLPSFAYKKPFKWLPGVRNTVQKYEKWKEIVRNKHKKQL